MVSNLAMCRPRALHALNTDDILLTACIRCGSSVSTIHFLFSYGPFCFCFFADEYGTCKAIKTHNVQCLTCVGLALSPQFPLEQRLASLKEFTRNWWSIKIRTGAGKQTLRKHIVSSCTLLREIWRDILTLVNTGRERGKQKRKILQKEVDLCLTTN